MFFNRNKNQDKPEADKDEEKGEKKGFFSFFSRSTPAEKANSTEPADTQTPAPREPHPDSEQAEPAALAPENAPTDAAPIKAGLTEGPLSEVTQEPAARPQELPVEEVDELEPPTVSEQPAPAPIEVPAPSAPPEISPKIHESVAAPAPEEPPSALNKAPSIPQGEPVAPKRADVIEKPKAQGWFARIKSGLSRTSNQFAQGLGNLLLGKKAIDDELLEDLETQLLVADVGIDATTEIIDELTESVERKQLADSGALYTALQEKLLEMLKPIEQPLVIDASKKPYVILVVGVNGVGKTTTIGKLAYQLRQEGKSVMLAAGDTFRAAAVEQLQVWGERNDIHVVAQHTGADSASVIYDAIASATSRQLDVVICDTAGRLHNKNYLMEELAKVKRVIGKKDSTAPHEVLLVLDAGTGQNAVSQAENFKATAGVTGIALTKLDGTAKGGVIFALSKKFALPVRYIGVGEGIEDLQPFRAKPFVDALFNRQEGEG